MELKKSDENEKIEELLMKLGLAFFLSQSIEYNMVTIFSFAQLVGEIDSELSIRESMNTYYSYTMGKTKNDLIKKLNIDGNLKKLLNDAIVARNWLTHNFYREYGLSAFNVDIRLDAIKKLDMVKDLFEEVNELLTQEIYRKGENAGYTKERIEEINEKYQKKSIEEVLPADKFWDEKLCKRGW